MILELQHLGFLFPIWTCYKEPTKIPCRITCSKDIKQTKILQIDAPYFPAKVPYNTSCRRTSQHLFANVGPLIDHEKPQHLQFIERKDA